MTSSKFSKGLFVGALVGTVASVACSDAATDMMGHVMRDAGGALVDAGFDLMDAGGDVRDASATMVDAARADNVTVREIACDRTATRTEVFSSVTYTRETFYAVVPVPGLNFLSNRRVEVTYCDTEHFGSSTPGTCPSGATCSGSEPDTSLYCFRGAPQIGDGSVYVSCGTRVTATSTGSSTPSVGGSRHRHVYLLTED